VIAVLVYVEYADSARISSQNAEELTRDRSRCGRVSNLIRGIDARSASSVSGPVVS